MFVCFVCVVLSGRGLCDELITHPEKPYRLWRVIGVVKNHRERGGHSPRWAAEPEIIIIIIIIMSLCAICCIIRVISSRKMSEACGIQEREIEK
jgi:hypothetical protein